jgi:gliding motility-associatede transport system auxiliary component
VKGAAVGGWRPVDFLAPLGFLVIVGAEAWERSGRTLPGKPQAWLIAGGALIVTHLLLRFEDITRRVGRRQMKYGANTAVLVLVTLAILGFVNYLAFRHTRRWDLTKGQRYSLSDQAKKILQGLKEDVTVWYFQRSTAPDLAAAQDHLKTFQAASPRVKVQFVDPLQNPARAQEYDARGPWPVVVVERGSKREKISNDSEQDLTNALIKVTRDIRKTVCFVEGEGERDVDDTGDRGLSGWKAALARSQYETQKVLLVREGRVPAACTVLVVAGPERDLLPQVAEAVRAYVRQGGKALLMVEPEMKVATPNLVALLKEWNLEAGRDVVVDVSGMGQLFGTGAITPIVAQYPYHEITKDFRVMTAFHTARSLEAGKAAIDGVTAQNLLETSPASWAESDLSLKEPIEMNEGKDRKGPLPLGAAATLRAEPSASPSPPAASPSPAPAEGEAAEKKTEARVVAIGDTDFATNQLLAFEGNQDFLLNTVAWLAQDADLISIRPKEPDDQRMFLTRQQQQNISLLALLIVPGLFVVLGIASWWRRR